MRWLLGLLVLCLVAVGGLWVAAGRGTPPALEITKPDRAVGQKADLEVVATSPAGTLTNLNIVLEQHGTETALFSLADPQEASVTDLGDGRTKVVRPIGKTAIPALQEGPATIVVSATRKSLLGLRTLSSRASRDVQVRLAPPAVAVLSTHHYINHGGAEMVIYRATPADVTSGVRVGDIEYPGFPAVGAGITGGDPNLKVAFFALLHNQDLRTPIVAFARDDAGNEATASFIDNVFEKPFKKSQIPIDDRFLQRVVPDILAHSPEVSAPADDLLKGFLVANGEVRRLNAEKITQLTAATAPALLFKGPFIQLGNSKVEASFADDRTYVYEGKAIDRQTHLGFDLARTAHVEILAANDGKVLNASWLGIYGNCVIIDHGMGIASLYGHLSSIDVKVGDSVTRGQVIGRSGATGMAGGDHLHFTMLVHGQPVNPVEWWDSHWISDRIDRKLREAGASSVATGGQPSRPSPRATAGGPRRNKRAGRVQ
ncbi:MAG: M23 family metallopeptidase [Acidobacteriaceae bacterium]|jgi:murein DD-endopeptidase MepM/ murein hydrolase activator NlpD|nr:M23 family metallopeptidase [Acidobacteriaceae bacterium]